MKPLSSTVTVLTLRCCNLLPLPLSLTTSEFSGVFFQKWKPVWLSLFPQSSSGVGRLEIQDMGGTRMGFYHLLSQHGVKTHYKALDFIPANH